MARQWDVEAEIRLLSLLCEYKPAGSRKQQNLSLILQFINESTDDKFTQDDIERKLDTLYDMSNVEKIEDDHKSDLVDDEEKEPLQIESKPEDALETEVHKAKPKPKTSERRSSRRSERLSASSKRGKLAHETTSATENSDAYSSELSDVEGEEAVFAKLNDKEMLSELAKKSSKPQTRKQERIVDSKDGMDNKTTDSKQKTNEEEAEPMKQEEEQQPTEHKPGPEAEEKTTTRASVDHIEPPLTRKRTRANAKLDIVEPPRKKPAKAAAKKVLKKEPTEVVEPPKVETPVPEEEPRKRRSVRQTVRRSLRK